MKSRIYLSVLVVFMALVSCGGLKGIKVPEDKKDYVGLWKSDKINLAIYENGRVEYEKRDGGSKKTISAPIQKFEGNNFVVGALGINTTFVVSDPPHQDSTGVWTMTVDGEVVIRN